jgi:2'-5' RNA ligase
VDHLVVPLDRTHADARAQLVETLREEVGVSVPSGLEPHITLVAHTGLTRPAAVAALDPVVSTTEPFTVHAHGYGVFSGATDSGLSLHVIVVRSGPLDDLHRRACEALAAAGADVAGWSTPDCWTPHLTLLDRTLEPESLGAAVTWLARRPHPSWEIPVDRLALAGPWRERNRPNDVLLLGR